MVPPFVIATPSPAHGCVTQAIVASKPRNRPAGPELNSRSPVLIENSMGSGMVWPGSYVPWTRARRVDALAVSPL